MWVTESCMPSVSSTACANNSNIPRKRSRSRRNRCGSWSRFLPLAGDKHEF